MNEYKIHARGWIERHAQDISDWHQIIWRLAEPAWREYRSAAWYVDRLRKEGFTVEEGSAGMPTAFCARLGKRQGRPHRGGLCRIRRHPRQLAGASALRMPPRRAQPLRRRAHRPPFRARHGLARRGAGRQGTPCGVTASRAGSNSLASLRKRCAAQSPCTPPTGITTTWTPSSASTRAAACRCATPSIGTSTAGAAMAACSPSSAPTPKRGARRTAVCSCRSSRWWPEPPARSMPCASCIRPAATPIPPCCLAREDGISVRLYLWADRPLRTISPRASGRFTTAGARPRWKCRTASRKSSRTTPSTWRAITHCEVRGDWVQKNRIGLPNHALARLAYRNMELAGPPQFGEEAQEFGRQILRNLGHTPPERPIMPECSELHDPLEADRALREGLPPWQTHFMSDDYVEYTWHAPTVRLFIGRCMVERPDDAPEHVLPMWVWNAMGGKRECIDPTIFSAARTIGYTVLDLMACRRTRTGQGGIRRTHGRRHRRQPVDRAADARGRARAGAFPLAGIHFHPARRTGMVDTARRPVKGRTARTRGTVSGGFRAGDGAWRKRRCGSGCPSPAQGKSVAFCVGWDGVPGCPLTRRRANLPDVRSGFRNRGTHEGRNTTA